MLDVVKLPQEAPAVKPGDVVEGRYKILETVAEGGMGTVFLAEHVLIKRRVALKVLHRALATDTTMIQRFMNEALAAGTLGHPNIVESTDMGFTSDRVPFIVFEYLEGAVLTEEIYRVGGLPVRRALRIARQVASALDAAHSAGIVHLDLKSDNVFLTDKDGAADHVKVLDFGISRFLDADSKTTRGLVMGTPEFMAPEQVTTPDDVDRRADIYALGVLLYEMLTARRPFAGTDPRILLYRIVHELPPPLDRVNVAPPLEAFVLERLLAKDRSARIQTMKEVETTLEAMLDQLHQDSLPGLRAVSLPAVAPPEAPTIIADHLAVPALGLPPRPRRRRRRPALLGLAAMAAVAGLGFKFGEVRVRGSTLEAATTTLQANTDQLATAIVSQARAAQLRADSIAKSPVLRTAIVTDAATIQDLARSEALVSARADEVIEVFQSVRGQLTSVLRLPPAAPPLRAAAASEMRVEADANGIVTVATAPILDTRGNTGGAIAIASHVDLAKAKQLFAGDALAATLIGLARPLELVAPHGEVGVSIDLPVAVDPAIRSAPLVVTALVRPVERGRTFRTTSHAAFGAGVVMLLGFFAIKKRAR